MHPHRVVYDAASALPVTIVIACTSLVAIAISAWLVRDVARRAIERTSPDKVPAVVQALGSLLHPLRLFLPWSGRRAALDWRSHEGADHSEIPHNESSPALQKGSSDEA
ncbi:MAG: hypothetical protein ACRDNF_25170 [Streptosporangiaceae bacterium]